MLTCESGRSVSGMELRFDLGHLFASLSRFPHGTNGLFLSRLFSQAPPAPPCLDVGPHKATPCDPPHPSLCSCSPLSFHMAPGAPQEIYSEGVKRGSRNHPHPKGGFNFHSLQSLPTARVPTVGCGRSLVTAPRQCCAWHYSGRRSPTSGSWRWRCPHMDRERGFLSSIQLPGNAAVPADRFAL